jgi:O-antigen ligase
MHFKVRDTVFPVALLAFEAVGVQYWNVIFSDQTRWLFLVILVFSVLIRGQLSLPFRGTTGLLLVVYLGWCVCTIAWSEVPQLSLLKVLALIGIVVGFAGAGQAWTLYSKPSAPFGFLLPVVWLALSAGLFYRGAAMPAGSITIYEGLAGNPNYLGAIAAMGFPYALWQAYANKSRFVSAFLHWGLIFGLLIVIWRSGSRAALLFMLMTFAGFLVALRPGTKILTFGVVGMLAVGAAIAVPAVQASLYERFIVKGGDTGDEADALLTRRDLWSDSYELAKQGGLIGGGYGVTIGSPTEFSLSLTAVGYGREKGNSQLAIWEETGMIGLALYALLIMGIIVELGSSFRRMRDPQSKVELGLLFGALLGILVQSIFEAWWVAPGSAESAFFWAVFGAAYGTVHRTALHPQLLGAQYKSAKVLRAGSPAVSGPKV